MYFLFFSKIALYHNFYILIFFWYYLIRNNFSASNAGGHCLKLERRSFQVNLYYFVFWFCQIFFPSKTQWRHSQMDSITAFELSRPGFNPSHQQKFFSKFSFKLEEMSFGEVFQWRNDFGGVMFRWRNVSVRCFSGEKKKTLVQWVIILSSSESL
jgi:hypothetical protein